MDFDKMGTFLLTAAITPLTIGLTWYVLFSFPSRPVPVGVMHLLTFRLSIFAGVVVRPGHREDPFALLYTDFPSCNRRLSLEIGTCHCSGRYPIYSELA